MFVAHGAPRQSHAVGSYLSAADLVDILDYSMVRSLGLIWDITDLEPLGGKLAVSV